MDTTERGRVDQRAATATSTQQLFELDRQALSGFGELLEEATPDELDGPTPCTDWSVRDLIEHTVGLTFGMAEALRDGDAPAEAYRPRPATQWPEAVRAMGRAWASWTENAAPTRVRVAPVSADATFSTREVVEIHLLDILAHSWDLASALRTDYDPGEAAVAVLDVAGRVASRTLPSTRAHFGAPFARDDDAEPWHRVLRLLGRDPRWRPRGVRPSLNAVGIAERLTRFSEVWSPKIIARVNDHEIKVVKLSGEFDWHSHADADEVFVVVTGRMRIEMRHGSVAMGPGDLYVVPRGVEHRPVATVPTEAILLEPAGVVNTGDAGGPLTAVDEDLT